jgi:RNA polymerase sigma-70 factor (ECF subfamily)
MAIAFDIVGVPYARPPLKEASQSATLPAPEHVHARYAGKIRRHVGRVMGLDDEHEDVVQEVLMVVLRKLDTVRDLSRLDGWVAQVTTNTLRLTMRRRSIRRRALGRFLDQQGDASIQPDVEARYVADRVMRAMERLSPNERALLVARWFAPGTEDAIMASIAAKSGCSIFTVRRRLSRARARFEKLARRDPAHAPCLREAGGTEVPKADRRIRNDPEL